MTKRQARMTPGAEKLSKPGRSMKKSNVSVKRAPPNKKDKNNNARRTQRRKRRKTRNLSSLNSCGKSLPVTPDHLWIVKSCVVPEMIDQVPLKLMHYPRCVSIPWPPPTKARSRQTFEGVAFLYIQISCQPTNVTKINSFNGSAPHKNC